MSTPVIQAMIASLQLKINSDSAMISNNQAVITDLTSKNNVLQQDIQDSQSLMAVLLTM